MTKDRIATIVIQFTVAIAHPKNNGVLDE